LWADHLWSAFFIMAELKITTNFTASYYTNDVPLNDAGQLWFVFHGYGQLAGYFINKFHILTKNHIRVVAPQGLSKFYLDEQHNRVGASWMTKENRLDDIENYIRYINHIYSKEVEGYKNIKITLLGFSQGAATVSRWLSAGNIPFERLILWAGLFPPDLDFVVSKDKLKDKKVVFVVGDDDPYINDARFMEFNLLSKELEINPEIVRFKGVHNIDTETLTRMI